MDGGRNRGPGGQLITLAIEKARAVETEELIHATRPRRISLRPYHPAVDAALVFDSWCKQIRRVAPFRSMDGQDFHEHRRIIEALVARCSPIIAYETGHPAQRHGYACGEVQQDGKQVLHMVYVRRIWRRRGTAGTLLKTLFPDLGKAPVYYTHDTRSARYHAGRWRLRLNHYLVHP